MTDHAASDADSQRTRRRQKRRILTSLFFLFLCIVLQITASMTSHQIANMGTALCGFICSFVLLRWWWGHSEISRFVRLLPIGGIALGIGVFACLFELKGVNGELVPEFQFRFSSAPELLVESIGNAKNPENLRLSIEGSAYAGFLGKNRNGVIETRTFSLDSEQITPKLRWKHPLGAGLAGISVAFLKSAEDVQGDNSSVDATAQTPGTAFTSGHAPATTKEKTQQLLFTMEQRDDEEWITCYEASDGRLRWHHAYPAFHTHFLGDTGPRSTPTIDEQGRIFTLGATGQVCCLDGITGKLLWSVDLFDVAGLTQSVAEQGVTWGRAASPLRVDDLVVLPLGGDPDPNGTRHTLIALEADSGKPRWTSGNHQISYASPVLATLCGIRQILSVDEDYVSATNPEDGSVLWTYPWPGKSNAGANCSNPIPLQNNRVLLTKEYGGGAMMLYISEENGQLRARPLWESSQLLKTKFTNAVTQGSFAYGLSDGTLECVDIDAGERRWKQNRRQRFGHGHVLLVEDSLVCTSEEGEIVIVRATPEAYEEVARFPALSGKTWNPFAIVDNCIYVRNGQEIAAWEITPTR